MLNTFGRIPLQAAHDNQDLLLHLFFQVPLRDQVLRDESGLLARVQRAMTFLLVEVYRHSSDLQQLAAPTSVRVYVCDWYSAWQRGT
ncbi:MAG: hypothetical protein JNM01_04230 [Delftia acidovorans]|nr:hypothetical protein [Delftia acidovorans]